MSHVSDGGVTAGDLLAAILAVLFLLYAMGGGQDVTADAPNGNDAASIRSKAGKNAQHIQQEKAEVIQLLDAAERLLE